MMNIELRRSIRKYADREVSEEMITRLLSVAGHTQTMGNLQLYSVVETRSQKMKEALLPAHFGQPMVTGAKVVLTFCADFRRTTLWAENRNAHPGYDNFLSFLNAMTDALLYCQTFCNLAEAEGLGLCFLGTTVYQPLAIIKVLQLPKLVMPVATITVGWPDEEPPVSDRLPVEAILHKTIRPIESTPSMSTRKVCPRTSISWRLTISKPLLRSLPTSDTRRRTMKRCRKVLLRRSNTRAFSDCGSTTCPEQEDSYPISEELQRKFLPHHNHCTVTQQDFFISCSY